MKTKKSESKFGFIAEAALELKAAAGEAKRPTFQIAAYNGGMIKPNYMFWPTPVVMDLAGLTAAEPIAALLDHYSSDIVGQSTSVEIGKSGVQVNGVVTGDIENPDDPAYKVMLHSRNGFQWKASVGIDPQRYEKVEAGAIVKVNGREFAGSIYVLRAGIINEVSFLSVSADGTTSAKIAAGAAEETKMDFNEWLQNKGFEPAKLDEKQRDSLLASFKAETGSANAGPSTPAEKAAAAVVRANPGGEDGFAHLEAENARKARIRARGVQFATDNGDLVPDVKRLTNAAIAAGTQPETFEAQLYQLRGEKPIGRSCFPPPDDRDKLTPEVFEAGICMALNLPNHERQFKPEILEASRKRWRRGLTLGEFVILAAQANDPNIGHISLRDPGQLRDALVAAFSKRPRRSNELLAGGFSTLDIDGILSAVSNKILRDAFMAVESSWAPIAARVPVSDFKAIPIYSLTGDLQYEKIGAGGEIKHGKLGETSYSLKADTYAKMLAITRQDIVNDDLGALSRVNQRLGRGGALKINDVFWTEFLANSAFFTSGLANYISGAATVLSADSLKTAKYTFRRQTDPDGKPLGSNPRVLLVPPELEDDALRLVSSIELREIQDTAAGAGTVRTYGTFNPNAGRFIPVVSAYLSNSSYTGYSITAWYIIADPSDVPVMAIGFLNGQEAPTVESAEADFDKLGIQIRGYHDFGVTKMEYRGGVKSKGGA